MNAETNPYTPGAGVPPPELAGRDDLIKEAKLAIKRVNNGKAAKSLIMLGLRGVGKTVLLNRIEEIAENLKCPTAFMEADEQRSLPEILIPQLSQLLRRLSRLKKTGEEVRKAFKTLTEFVDRVRIGEFEIGLSKEEIAVELTADLTDICLAIGRAAQSRKTVAVVLIDELQYVDKKDLSALIMAIHKVSQRQLPLMVFAAGMPQMAKLANDAKTYSERLFNFKTIDKLNPLDAQLALEEPAKREGVAFNEDALNQIIMETEGYPYFLQVWGELAWEIAPKSPITLKNVQKASEKAIKDLDDGFFRYRYERLSPRQREYVMAMFSLGLNSSGSGAIARQMGLDVKQAAPIRDGVIKAGVAYSPMRGYVSFSVPKFDAYLQRRKTKN